MGSIILLAFGACFFPTLLACVAIMISRPEPRRLLIAFYAGGLVTSVSTGIVVLAVFNNGEAVLGSTRSSPHPTTSIIVGLVALLLAWLMASAPSNATLNRWRSRHGHRRKSKQVDRQLQLPRAGRAHPFVQCDHVLAVGGPARRLPCPARDDGETGYGHVALADANGLRITGWLVGLLGASLLAQGIAALAG